MSWGSARRRIIAVLGPTNTGKTYLAIERMVGHGSGMIGFPLRLLARENYERVVRLKGARQTALITGEEKIVPPSARYFVCTTESMPLDRPVDFLAVDEIQMCADAERGHVFTDRLLRARGLVETVFLGAETIRPLLRRLLPEAEIITRPRLSRLSYAGPKKLTRLPPRSAVVAFSADDVYQIAELLRRQRGGAAVVLGALSPRTRNAQVAMFQAGEVDYLVATDAIGMGLNMDIDHVVFSRLVKFDGRRSRRLNPAEIGQIAGRAGRHMNDGTFGPSAELGAFEPEVVEAVESHRFEPLRTLSWRNAGLDFSSARALLSSLEAPPPRPELGRARRADDHHALIHLARDPEVERLARHPAAVRLLWDVCQVPDYRKTMTEAHLRLLRRLFGHLGGGEGRLPSAWVADQIARLDRPDGDIDTLMARIAHVRTWTYVSHRADWLDDAAHWQERARAVEDRLSDALHERLTQRFVDRGAAALSRARGKDVPVTEVDPDGAVHVEGEYVGRLEGFRFQPDASSGGRRMRAAAAAANRALRDRVTREVAALAEDADDALALDDDGRLTWRGAPVGRLRRGTRPVSPRVEVMAGDLLGGPLRERVRARLATWLERHLGTVLRPLHALDGAALDGAARGLAFQLVQGLGTVSRRAAARQAAAIEPAERTALRRLGVRFAEHWIYLPALLKPRAARLCALLWRVHEAAPAHEMPPPGSVSVEACAPAAFYRACGFQRCGARAIRIDVLDRLALRLREVSQAGAFVPPPDLLARVGLSPRDLEPALRALGYDRVAGAEAEAETWRRRPRQGSRRQPPHRRRRGADSPFAKLSELQLA